MADKVMALTYKDVDTRLKRGTRARGETWAQMRAVS